MNALLLLLVDSRAPAGAHHHSGGMEAAVGTGLVTGLASLEDFCRARLRTSARVAAAFAAASCWLQSHDSERTRESPPSTSPPRPPAPLPPAASAAASCWLQPHETERTRVSTPATPPARPPDPLQWAVLDAEFEARTVSEAMRTASRQLGGGLVRPPPRAGGAPLG